MAVLWFLDISAMRLLKLAENCFVPLAVARGSEQKSKDVTKLLLAGADTVATPPVLLI